MTTIFCSECLDSRRCWVCEGEGLHAGGDCRPCTGSGDCRLCARVRAAA